MEIEVYKSVSKGNDLRDDWKDIAVEIPVFRIFGQAEYEDGNDTFRFYHGEDEKGELIVVQKIHHIPRGYYHAGKWWYGYRVFRPESYPVAY